MKKPFYNLKSVRNVDNDFSETDLKKFYSMNEGFGIDSDSDNPIRFCKLDELKLFKWQSINISKFNPIPTGWKNFAGILIGVGMFFEEIFYVLRSPVCNKGAIMATGGQITGPGGQGPFVLERTLVLARSFEEWLQILKPRNWTEPAILGLNNFSKIEQKQILEHYIQLNPCLVIQ